MIKKTLSSKMPLLVGLNLGLLLLTSLCQSNTGSMSLSYAGTGPSLPSMDGNAGWLGLHGPVSPPSLSGKVVLFDFWDYTCVNCIRTFPHLNHLYETYRDDGLVIVGIHSPEFSFAALPSRVQHAIDQYSLPFPVVLDRDQVLWNRFHNHYWPSDYLYDRNGHLVYHSFGEGGYERLETKIREALGLGNGPSGHSSSLDFPETLTPELYAGYDRGRLGNGTGYHPDTSFLYHGTSLPEGIIKLGGRWIAHADHLSSGSRSGKPPSTLTVLYHGTGVNAVLKRSSGSKNGLGDPVLVLVDGKPVPRLFSGKDLQGQGSGMKGDSRLSVLQARMYAIVSGQRFGAHRLDLFFLRKGTEVYTLTFNP